jgi:hypothetical protein
VVFGLRGAEARSNASAFLDDGYFPLQGTEIKDCFEAVKGRFRSVDRPNSLAGRPSSGPPTGGRTHSQHLP